MNLRITPVWIESLDKNEVLVFDSYKSGNYNSEMGKLALRYGAQKHKKYGMSGNTFAIPTRDDKMKALPLVDIDIYVEGFLIAAEQWAIKKFFVTEIGCSSTAYKPWEIAPMFKRAMRMKNVFLPDSFLKILLNESK